MTRPIRVLELRSVRGTGGGPEKTILLGAARSDPRRFAVTVCYVRDARDLVFGIDSHAANLPVHYTELIERHSFDPSIWRGLRRLAREHDIDIVHSHDYKTDLLAWLLSKSNGIHALSTAHGWTGHSFRERRIYYPLGKRLLTRFQRVIAVSSDIKRELIRHGASPAHITTILNGIDHRQFKRDRSCERSVRQQLGIAEDSIVVGSVGRLERQKRFDLLIDAIDRVRSSVPNVTLLVVGDGSAREALTTQISRLGLGDACRLGSGIAIQRRTGAPIDQTTIQALIGIDHSLRAEALQGALPDPASVEARGKADRPARLGQVVHEEPVHAVLHDLR